MDLAQTIFECCAITSSVNYNSSLWKLQSLGKKELTVPLTCCQLENWRDSNAYLDPIPRSNNCQAEQIHEYERNRHMIVKIIIIFRKYFVLTPISYTRDVWIKLRCGTKNSI